VLACHANRSVATAAEPRHRRTSTTSITPSMGAMAPSIHRARYRACALRARRCQQPPPLAAMQGNRAARIPRSPHRAPSRSPHAAQLAILPRSDTAQPHRAAISQPAYRGSRIPCIAQPHHASRCSVGQPPPTRHFHIQPRLVVLPGHGAARHDAAAVTHQPRSLRAASTQPPRSRTHDSRPPSLPATPTRACARSPPDGPGSLQLFPPPSPRHRGRADRDGVFKAAFTGASPPLHRRFTAAPHRQGEYRACAKPPSGLDLACISRSDQVSW
jgi:hypothetical protein